jgi:AcrR family transcriptional regulator
MSDSHEGNALSVPKRERTPVSAKVRMPRRTPRLNDVRSLRSQTLLRNALLRLVTDRSFDKITLRDITAEAGVSYPTFFNHYDSKEDLFQDIAREQIVGLLAAFRTERTSPDWRPGEGMCVYVVERRNLWHTLLTAGASEAMRSEFIRQGRELATDRPSLAHGFPFDVVSGVIYSGTFEIIAWWLMQDADFPTATVSNMLETLVLEPALGLPAGYFTDRRGLRNTVAQDH